MSHNARERKAEHAEWQRRCAEETARIAAQRAAWDAAIPEGHLRDALLRAMLDRALWLLDTCPEAADAILEFAPEPDATKLLDEYFNDDP